VLRKGRRNSSPDNTGAGAPPPPRPPDEPPAGPIPPKETSDEKPSDHDTAQEGNDVWRVPDLQQFAARRAQRNATFSTPEGPKTYETGSWIANLPIRVAGVRRRIGEALVGMKDAAGAIIDTARGRAESAKEWAEKKADTPLGKALLKAGKQIIEDIADGRKRSKAGIIFQLGALYTAYKAKEIWDEKKWDVATGLATGAAVRPLLLMIGVETYLASAGIAFITGATRKGLAELDNYITPETDGTRKSLVGKIRALDGTQKREIAMKMLVAGSISGVSSFAGAGLVHWTGADVLIRNAAKPTIDKIGGVFSSLGESLPIVATRSPGLAKTDITGIGSSVVNRPGILDLAIESVSGPTVDRPGLDQIPNGIDSAPIVDRPGTPPAGGEVMNPIAPDSVTKVPPIDNNSVSNIHPPGLVETVPINPVEAAIDNIPDTKLLPPGSTPWAVAEQLLKEANPNGSFTPKDIMEVDKILCEQNKVIVPEWGITGDPKKGWISHGSLGSTGPFAFTINDKIKDTVRTVAYK
jgi:hypothetical protein